MSAAALAFTVVTAVALAALLAIGGETGPRHGVLKGTASAGFVAVGIASGALDSAYGIAVLVALVLSWFGDVLLVPKGEGWFTAGLAAFLTAHVAYAVGFVGLGVAVIPTIVAAVAMTVVGRLVWTMIQDEVGDLGGPVIAYIAVIGAMVALGVGASVEIGVFLIGFGVVTFAASDIAVARHRFATHSFVERLWGLPAYYAAQVALAYSVAVVSG